jgi:hypothetical protein
MDIEKTSTDTFTTGAVVVNIAPPVTLPRIRAYKVIKLKAHIDNTDPIYICGQHVLVAGEEVELHIDWLDKIWAYAADDDQTLVYLVA